MRCQNAANRVLKVAYKLNKGLTKARQGPFIGRGDHAGNHGPQFPNQNLKYAINFCDSPYLDGAPIEIVAKILNTPLAMTAVL